MDFNFKWFNSTVSQSWSNITGDKFMSREKKEEKSTEKTINDLIIDEAVKQFKEG